MAYKPIKDGSDRGGYPPDTTTRSFVNGVWRNSNGAQVAVGRTPTSAPSLQKSTGDLAPEVKSYKGNRTADGGAVAKYVKQRKAAGAKGY